LEKIEGSEELDGVSPKPVQAQAAITISTIKRTGSAIVIDDM